MTDAFLATIVSGEGVEWIVSPLIIENDGTQHPDITVTTQTGLTPEVDDIVLILTMRNNLDLQSINRFYDSSESNGVIVGIVQTSDSFTFTGDYNFIGDILVDGDLDISGDTLIEGNLTVLGNINVTGSITGGALNVTSAMIGPVDFAAFYAQYLSHMHGPGTYTTPSGAVTGASGAPL